MVPADGSTTVTSFNLREGASYKLTAAGLYSYGAPDEVADPVCAWARRSAQWSATPGRARKSTGSLDLSVNGKRVFGSACKTRGHAYTAAFTATASKPLRLRVVNQRREAAGSLVVVVSRRGTDVSRALPSYPSLVPAPAATPTAPRGYGLVAETVTVPADADGVWTSKATEPGAEYRLTVSGVADLGGGVRTDGQCLWTRGAWYPSASMDLRVPGEDHGNLYVDGVPFSGAPASPGDTCASRTHAATYTADADGRLRLALWDPLGRSGNSGALTVRVQRLTALAEPTAAPSERVRKRRPEWSQGHDWFQVGTDRPEGAVSTMKLRRGERVQVTVRGTQRSNGYDADATCLRTAAGWLPRDPENTLAQDPLELWVDGQEVRWRALGRFETCSEDVHSYTTWFTATKNGPVRLAVLDLDHRDNKGTLDVTLLRD